MKHVGTSELLRITRAAQASLIEHTDGSAPQTGCAECAGLGLRSLSHSPWAGSGSEAGGGTRVTRVSLPPPQSLY